MSEIRFEVNAVPVPQPRARATAFKGRARMYEAKASHPIHAFKAAVQHAAAMAYSGAPIESPIRLSVGFCLPRPKLPKKAGKGSFPHTKRGDVDNFLKAVMDALNKRLWKDDAQVWQAAVEKLVAGADEQPRAVVVVQY